MAVTYKDIDLLTQKSSVEGTEKIPVSDTEYISPSQILGDHIAYQLRTDSMNMRVSGTTYRYRLLFTSADGTQFVPANTSTSTSASEAKTVNQTKIDPFGSIRYYHSTTSLSSGGIPSAATLWQQRTLMLGYSFNRTGSALALSSRVAVYIKCAPQSDGSAIIDADTPFVQALPSAADGKIYIYLGVAHSASSVEMTYSHPVYYHDGIGIRLWSGKDAYVKPSTGIPATDLASGVIPTKTSDLSNDSGFRKIIISSSDPTSADGADGDVWIKYSV